MDKEALKPGFSFRYRYLVPPDKTVPHLFPEFDEGRRMPEVLATGFMVGLFEFACIKAINPHLDWPREQTVGIAVDVSHTAATPPGLTVTVHGTLEQVEGRKLTFRLTADDGIDQISSGRHVRYVIDAEKFNRQVAGKAGRTSG